MVYTCYEMIRDCRADQPAGWSFFVSQYVPAIRRVLAHYAPDSADRALLERIVVLLRRPDSSLWKSLEPAPERWFVAELRQQIVAELPVSAAEIELDLPTAAEALEPLTVTEKLAAWLEALRYSPQQSGPMLRVSAATVEKIRARAGELIRGKVDAWRRTLLAENGLALSRAAGTAGTPDCLPAKAFLDILDGRTTWSGREQMERHVTACWHCID
ncbi:MAG TPA: hypothetical protein VKE70_04280, partial [Candidatus Solibacter sp.]|nr:hypothetical protein [Candidatus Solibacter sp.]